MKELLFVALVALICFSFTKESYSVENQIGCENITSSDFESVKLDLTVTDAYSESSTLMACEWVDFTICGFIAPGKVLQIEVCDGSPSGRTRIVDCNPS
ncbi:hypothetical protein [Flagellimonas sp.]|uniref:hypothetical protein n=1 Tax=Flagellimonas sp. TaxID=2058762 RepID=UPI003B510480